MIEPIEWYEQQKEKYTPIIRQFERELAFYVGDDLSEFKLNLPTFQIYINSETFKNKLVSAITAFRLGIVKNQLTNGETIDRTTQSTPEESADTFITIINMILQEIETDEIRLPTVGLIEILYSLANRNNNRLKRQQSLYRQIIVSLVNEPQTVVIKSDGFICNMINVLFLLGDMVLNLVKNEFNESDVQYPLLLALSLSHTSPRNVKVFLDKQPPQYKGDFSKVLRTALLEYDDLLLSSQLNKAYEWLNEYKPIIQCDTVVEDDLSEFEMAAFETVEIGNNVEIVVETVKKQKPTIDFHSVYVNDIFDILKGYFDPSEYDKLQTLLNRQTIEGSIYFRGKGASLFCGFRDLLDSKILLSSQAETIRWLVTYITADNQKDGKNKPILLRTVEKYFEDDKKNSHNRVNFDEIIEKKRKKS